MSHTVLSTPTHPICVRCCCCCCCLLPCGFFHLQTKKGQDAEPTLELKACANVVLVATLCLHVRCCVHAALVSARPTYAQQCLWCAIVLLFVWAGC